MHTQAFPIALTLVSATPIQQASATMMLQKIAPSMVAYILGRQPLTA